MKFLVVLLSLCALVALAPAKIDQSGIKCAVCQYAIQEAEVLATSDLTEAKLSGAINAVCRKVNMQSFCDTFIIPYVAQILQAVVNRVNPDQVCERIHLCDANVQVLEIADAKRSSEVGIKCSACEAVVEYVQNHLNGHPTQDKIQALVTAACGRLPFVKKVCQKFVAPIVTQLVVAIVEKIPADTFCQSVHLCDA
jgi:hypothetical protein